MVSSSSVVLGMLMLEIGVKIGENGAAIYSRSREFENEKFALPLPVPPLYEE
jgi:hypothetical protein